MLVKTLKENRSFFIPYLFILLLLLPFFFLHSKGETHLFINQYHSGFFDLFFRYMTFLGDGLFVIIPAVILLFFSLRHFVFLATAYLGSGLVAQILKRVFFEDTIRPSRYFQNSASLHFIDGVEMFGSKSFPSGHSTSAFALFLCIALISKNRTAKFICFILACLTAFSRVYLSQHFLIDIYAGSLLGSICALAFYQLFYHNERKWYAWSLKNLYKKDKYSA
jgi:membrane-associated phospholipid phosphatase